MKKKKDQTVSLHKNELQKQLKRKDSAVKRMKRELKIEAALEQVRARAMTMQKSDELYEMVKVLFKQLSQPDLMLAGDKTITIVTFNDDKKEMNFWITGEEFPEVVTTFVPYTKHAIISDIWKAKEKGHDYFSKVYSFKEKNKYWKWAFEFTNNKNLPEDVKRFALEKESYAQSVAFAKHSGICIPSYEGNVPSKKDSELLIRFAKVFDQSYIRFLDLQKAEAQERESQIEAALEKVRSRSLAMHKSDELGEIVKVVLSKLNDLDIRLPGGLSTAIFTFIKGKKETNFWITGPDYAYAVPTIMGYYDHPIVNDFLNARDSGVNYFSKVYDFEEKNRWWKWAFVHTDSKNLPDDIKKSLLESESYSYSIAFAKHSGIYIDTASGKVFTEKESEVLIRFANVFDQTYTRFLDLQKAEAQARESQIEAALERVRSRTMAMQNSDELAELVATVFTELNRLEFALTSCIIWINNPELLTAEMWVASTELNKPPEPYYIKPFRHPYFKSVIDAFKEKNKKWVYEMKGEEKKIFQQQFFNEVGSFPTLIKKALQAPESVVYSASFYNFGALEIVGTEHVTDEKFEILHRLGKVFDMSYTRFNDLKQAEAQAQEARIETALERVRSRTLAMQKSDELAETAAVLFRQLILLGMAPNRLYIGIIKDDNGLIEFWVTDDDGSKVSTQFTGDVNRNASMKKMYGAWKEEKKSLAIDMQGKELENYFHYLADELNVPFKEGLSQKRRVQSIAFFGKGFIGIASPDEQPEATISLLERFAAVFNLTYTRFNDLKVAEAHAIQAEEDLIKLQTEKKRAENALTELRTTQAQLIQSEKMASLGELTAGIAHEIQNPLNFVNNFSEVNTELIAEMKEEIDKGNVEEARAIANDIADNEQKINHHGKRADAIVKGMLQHSRSSSATKEPTDINKLADEYLRLAYHGLRAKDKSFNATLHTAYDETIGNINIVPQDIGRVILNLITNAFYAINEKKMHQPNGYEPAILISTRKLNNTIELTVKDNGNGIPRKVLDKIFQPFFTTKPTGQGTGLGLSLAYDIVKAHAGELKVETREASPAARAGTDGDDPAGWGEGSKFIIQLPIA